MSLKEQETSMNLFTALFSTWKEARRRVDDFRTGNTHELQGHGIGALNLLSDLRIHLDNLFNECPTLQDAQTRLNAFLKDKTLNQADYLLLWDAAHHYYAGTVHRCLMYRRRVMNEPDEPEHEPA